MTHHTCSSFPMATGRFCLITLITLILLFVGTCESDTSQSCRPSFCGNIPNISFPFRLKTDPHNCGLTDYELECEKDNNTVLYLNSLKYYVLAISYENYTIRVIDPAIKKNHCPSFPLQFLSADNTPMAYQFLDSHYRDFRKLNTPVMFVSCSQPVESSLYTVGTASCNASVSFSSITSNEYGYVLLGDNVRAADVDSSCTINAVAWASSAFPAADNTSYLSILDMLANGFELSWHQVPCRECEARSGDCYLNGSNAVQCFYFKHDKCLSLYWYNYLIHGKVSTNGIKGYKEFNHN